MSMNPARTFGSALPAGVWTAVWVYFLAPTIAMLAAGRTYLHFRGAHRVFCAKYHHHNDKRCIFRCNFSQLMNQELSKMSNENHYDVIIIGTGAGGGTLARKLAPTGKRILLLERGDYVPREKENWSTRAVNVEGKYQTKEIWRDRDGKPLHPHTNYCVGGNTKFYGAALFRLRREDFGDVRHHGGISPAWPISYDELEPYYTQAEQHLSRARRARRGSDRAAAPARLIRIPPSATSRASSN